MGASGWDYRVPYQGSVEETLAALQDRVLATEDYFWFDDEVDDEDYDDEAPARPATRQELADLKQDEEFWEVGTHSILDVDRVVSPADRDDDGTIRPLADEELEGVFGTTRPNAEQFEGVYRPGLSGPLADLMGQRWSGRSLVIYTGDVPSEMYFWGYSGD